MRFLSLALILSAASCSHSPSKVPGDPKLRLEGETRLENIRQLTHGGANTEARWSFDGRNLVFQHSGPVCDQTYSMKTDGSEVKILSNGLGLTSSPFFLSKPKADERALFSSTFQYDEKCPTLPDMNQGYVRPTYPTYQIYTIKTDGTDLLPLEPGAPRAYNSETSVCQDGSVIFTSDRDGDLELYRGKLDRAGTLTEVTRLTKTPGYDGGAKFSPDCSKIVWHASRPRPGKEAQEYEALLKKHLVRPTLLEIWMADADGTHARQITMLGAASFAPTFTRDGQRILFSSARKDSKGSKFDLHLIHTDGTHLERVTFSDGFDSFPMFSPEENMLAFSSGRAATLPHETNVFIADWVEPPTATAPLSVSDSDPANRFKAVIEKLTSPEMENRRPGTTGIGKAEDFVIEQFKAIGLKPFGADFKEKFEMALTEERHVIAANNVLGAWGKGCGKYPPVVVSATLDHVSGVAALLEVARKVVAAKAEPDACFVFATLTGKELKAKSKAILNLDQVGAMENNRLILSGSDSAKEWAAIIDSKCALGGLICDKGEASRSNVPALYFLTAAPVSDKADATSGVLIAETVSAIALQAASPKVRLHFQKGNTVSPKAQKEGPYLGAIPDYATPSSPEVGARLAGAHAGSPAEKAGIQKGDLLVGINQKPIGTLEDYMNMLAGLHPDEKILLHVIREKKNLALEATVGKRE